MSEFQKAKIAQIPLPKQVKDVQLHLIPVKATDGKLKINIEYITLQKRN